MTIETNRRKMAAALGEDGEGKLRFLSYIWNVAGRSQQPVYCIDEDQWNRIDIKAIAAGSGLKKKQVREVLNAVADTLEARAGAGGSLH